MAAVYIKLQAISKGRRPVNLNLVKDQIVSRMREAKTTMLKQLQTYPPPKIGSSYQRTGRLGKAWRDSFVAQKDELAIVLVNRQRYARYVHGDSHGQSQQRQHEQTGWPRVLGVVEQEAVKVRTDVQAIIDDAGTL